MYFMAKQKQINMTPQKDLLVKAQCIGDLGTWVTGYYHYDASLNEHYVCLEDSLFRKQVDPKTVKLINICTEK